MKQNQKKFIAVIGYRRSGKSTIIQSLTGCKNHSFIGEVLDRELGVTIFVHAPSPQENPKTGEREFAAHLRKTATNRSALGVVIAIQPTLARRRLLMDKMLTLAFQQGFDCFAFILEHPYEGKRIGNVENIKQRILASAPNAKLYSLDGRRFAVLNAESIRALSRITDRTS